MEEKKKTEQQIARVRVRESDRKRMQEMIGSKTMQSKCWYR